MRDRIERLEKASGIIKRHKLEGIGALDVLNEVVGTPEYDTLLVPKAACVCGKEFPLSSFPIVKTGVADIIYTVCPECRTLVKDLSHLCCLTCKTTVGHLEPRKEATGFSFRPGKYYHMRACPHCSDKKKGKADILEKVLFFKMNNIPTMTDPEFPYV